MRRWRRARRASRRDPGDDEIEMANEHTATRPSKRARRVERIARRSGLPALAVVGPIGLGTQVSAMVAVGLGVEAHRAFVWIAAGTVAWSITAALAAVTGMSIAGIGGIG